MDPPLINESTFSSANPSAYSLTEIWPFSGEPASRGLGLRMGNLGHNLGGFTESSMLRDGSADESTVTEQSGGGGGGGGGGSATGNQRKRKDTGSEDDSSKMVSTSSATELVGDLVIV